MSMHRGKKKINKTKRKTKYTLKTVKYKKINEVNSGNPTSTDASEVPVFSFGDKSEVSGVLEIDINSTGDLHETFLTNEAESDLFKRARENTYKIKICPNITSVHLKDEDTLFTNMVCSSSDVKSILVRSEILTIIGFDQRVLYATDLPIAFDFENEDEKVGNKLVNHLTGTKQNERFKKILGKHSFETKTKSLDIEILEKFEFINTSFKTKKKTGHRIIGILDKINRIMYIHFLDPHHLLATSFNAKVKYEYPKYSKFDYNISDVIR